MTVDERNYQDSVRKLCVHSAQLQSITEQAERGEAINTRMLNWTLCKVRCYRMYVLEDLNRMGVKANGIEFMEDNEYFGFSIKQGRLILEDTRDAVMETCLKWIRDFPDPANWYQYGAAMYAIALAYTDVIDLSKYYPPDVIGQDTVGEEAAA